MSSFHRFCEENNIPLQTMSNYDIIRVAKKLKIKNFRGCYMRDTLPKHINTNECGIVNLEPDSEQGNHGLVIINMVAKNIILIHMAYPLQTKC